MDRLAFFVCLLVDIFQVGLIIYLYNYYWKKIEPDALLLLKLFLYINLYKLIFNGIIVDVLRIISGGAESRAYGVSSFEILNVIGIELISNIIYYSAFTFVLFLIKFKPSKNKISLNEQIYILCSISLLSSLELVLPQFFTNILWLIKDALFFIGPICAIMVLILGIKYNKVFWILLGSLPIIITILVALISGLRGSIVGISICFMILSIIELDKKRVKKIILIGIIPILLLSLIQDNLNSLKYAFVVAVTNRTIDLNSISGYIDFLTAYFTDDSSIKKLDEEHKPIYREVEFRYGAPTLFAVGFVRMAERGEYALFNPIVNSFYSFLPRQIFGGDKPFPGSADGREKTMGMYACYKEITGYDYNMVDFSVSGHYYWEFGWIGVMILSIIPALYNVIVIQFCKRWSYIGAAILILSFKPFWFLTKLWISEIILMLPTILFPTLALIYILWYIFVLVKLLLNYKVK